MRILLTGGCGFLGAHITEHFLKTTEAEIVILDKLSYASAGFDRLRDIKAYDDQRVHVIGCDLSQPVPGGVAREVGTEIDFVIHAAAETHVDNSIADPLPFIQSNVLGVHHLLWWLRSMPLRHVFLVATDEVYGPALTWSDGGFDEQARFLPSNPYAATKAGGECLAMAYAHTYGLPVTIVNTMNLIGERQHPEKFIPMVIRSVLGGQKVLIHANATKTRSGVRSYLHCRTFAHALAFLMERSREQRIPRKVHVCGEKELSNLDVAQKIAGVVGRPLFYELVDYHSSRPGHDLRYALNDSLIRDLGWCRPMGIEESLEKTVRWSLANPKWLGPT